MKLLAILLACFALSALSARAAERPNIVFILADDLGYGDVGCYHAKSKIPTPHLDRLAREGMRFTDAHSPSGVCTPTRYALLTGRYAWRSPLQRGVLGPWGVPIIAADRLTVPALLRQHGYVTAIIGKWHLGLNYTTKDGKPAAPGEDKMSNVDFTKPIADGPTARGFDYYFGVNVPNYPPFCFIENDRTVGIPSVRDGGAADGINMPGPMLPGWKLVDILPELARRTERWIADAGQTGKPFFLYLPLTSPHFPVVPAPEFAGKSQAGDYGDFVVQTDDYVGRVLAALKKAGVAENTLVIFTSDNGPETAGEVNPGAYERIQKHQHASMGELRGVKRDLWEGGHRVPFLARWPGKIPAAAVSDETICHVDFMATIATLLDAKLPPNAGEDSFNLLPILRGEKPAKPVREATVHHGFSGRFAIRQGDWVLIEKGTGDDNRAAAGEPAWLKKARGYEPDQSEGQLYNLRADPAQKTNLHSAEPARVRELQKLLDKYRREGRSTPGPAQQNDPSPAEAAKLKNQSRP
jgi:arylsulfatase A